MAILGMPLPSPLQETKKNLKGKEKEQSKHKGKEREKEEGLILLPLPSPLSSPNHGSGLDQGENSFQTIFSCS